MPFLSSEDFSSRMRELVNSDLSEERKVEIITELNEQHRGGLEEYSQLQSSFEETQKHLSDTQVANARLYNQLIDKTFPVDNTGTPEDDFNPMTDQTLSDLKI